MSHTSSLEYFCVTAPGLETALADELADLGFQDAQCESGGVTVHGDWPSVWRAHLQLGGATRILVRLAAFPAHHLAQLHKRAQKIDWSAVLPADQPVRVDASCRGSRIYHSGAAAQRIEAAITDRLGTVISEDAELRIQARIDNNICTLSLNASGEPLHRRGWKQAVAKAPLRETLAALFLRQCGYRGTEPLVDPMCGSGTFPIEAAGLALGLGPGRLRRYAFEALPGFDPETFAALQDEARARRDTAVRIYGFDRDPGAVRMSQENAARAGVAEQLEVRRQAVDVLVPPEPGPGLVMVNPPYGARIGDKGALRRLYRTLGQRLMGQFTGWRVGLVTSEDTLARATGLPWAHIGPRIDHGGLKVRLYQSAALR